MKLIRNILLITLALLLQSTFFGRFDLYGVRPDLVVMVLIFLASEESPVVCIYYGFFIGFLQDVYSPEYLGFNAFTMSVMAFFLGIVKERLTVENFSVRLLITLLACMVHDIVYLSLYTRFDMPVLVQMFIRESIPGAVYTSVLAVLLIKVWQWAKTGGIIIVLRELLESRR